jgi:hypothetical protein
VGVGEKTVMTTSVVFPMATYSAGTRTIPAVPIPQGMNYLIFKIDITNISDKTPENQAKTMTLTLNMSLTGGNPYNVSVFNGMVFRGGIRSMNGTPPFVNSFGIQLPSPELSTRKINGTLVFSASVNISGEIEMVTY